MDCSTPGFPVHHQHKGVYSNSCPLSRWSHPTISSSIIPFSSCLQFFPASGSFQMNHLFASPWTAAYQSSLFFTNSRSLPQLMSIESVMLSNNLTHCRPLLLPPSIFPSIRVFSDESVICIKWPKYWSFSFNINPSNVYLGLISFRMDWLDLLAVQGLSRVFSNTTVQKHQFFGAQLSL